MNLFSRTLKSFNRKERIWGSVLLGTFLLSLTSIIFRSFFEYEPNLGNIYTEGVVGEILHLNPLFTELSEADGDVSSLIFSGLSRYNAETGEFEEDLATHTLSTDQLTYTFTLKNNVRWHDGVEVSADDVLYTFKTVIQDANFKNPLLKANFDGVKIEKIDSRTVSFTLSSPNSFFFTSLTVGLLPEHLLKEIPVAELDTASFNQMPVGSGPYQVIEPYSRNADGSTSVLLSQFKDYYGKQPQIERLKFIAYPTITDLVDNRATWNGAARIRQSLLEELDLEGMKTYRYELPQYTALFINTDSPFLVKNKARLGLSKAIDKDSILKAIDYKVRIDTPLLELSQNDWIHTYNTEEAKGALFDAGWALPEGELWRKNEAGETLTLNLIRRDFTEENVPQEETAKITAELIQKQLASVGVDLKIQAYPLEQLTEKIKKREYDLLLYGQSLGYNQDTFSYWHSSQANENGLNLSNYMNPAADLLIEKIRSNFDSDARTKLLEDLAQTIADDVPAIFLYTPSYYVVTDESISNFEFKKLLTPKDRFSTIANWQLNP